MRTTRAAGFILAFTGDGPPRYLLLRSARHGTWLPPKGHVDEGETLLDAARRETLEEAGIAELHVIDGARWDIRYVVDGREDKTATYFLAAVDTSSVVLSPEHSDAGWFTLPEALKLLAFEEIREAFKQADARLTRA